MYEALSSSSALARALGVLGRGLARNMLFLIMLPHSVSTFSIGSNMPPAASAFTQGIGKLRKVWCCEMESHKRDESLVIVPYLPEYESSVLDMCTSIWHPVFYNLRDEVPPYVYKAFYPNGWEDRQMSDIGKVLREESDKVSLALWDGELAGLVAIRLHPEDQMGEVHVIGVDPDYQRRGVAQALLDHAQDQMRAAGMSIVMVETGGDSGHAPARATYEAAGFETMPVARYFREL